MPSFVFIYFAEQEVALSDCRQKIYNGREGELGRPAPKMVDNARTFPVSDRLLDHRRKMGSSIWEYLWLRAHVTIERECKGESLGLVDEGRPVPTSRIAADLMRSREAMLTNMEKLAAGNYIERSADAGHAYTYRVRILLEGPRG